MNEQDFLAKFIPAYEQGNMAVLHELRRNVFFETAQIVKNGSYTTDDGGQVALPDPSDMMNGSEMYCSIEPVVLPEQPAAAIIEVKDSDSLLAGKQLLEEGYHPAVLNFANRQTAGGGRRGAGWSRSSRGKYFPPQQPFHVLVPVSSGRDQFRNSSKTRTLPDGSHDRRDIFPGYHCFQRSGAGGISSPENAVPSRYCNCCRDEPA